MYKKFVFAAILFTSLSGCKSKSAVNFSDNILAKEKSLMPDIQETENKVKQFVSAGQYDSIAAAGIFMEGLVQKKIDEIEAMPLPKVKEAGSFKDAAIRYFRFIKKMYTGYKDWGHAQNEEERQQVLADLRNLLEGKQAAVDEMQNAQRKYADANGIKIK